MLECHEFGNLRMRQNQEPLGLEKLARDSKLLELGAGTTDINLLAAARELIGPTD